MLNDVYKKVIAEKSNKVKEEPKISMAHKDYIAEHKRLIPVLRSGDKKAQEAEAAAQEKEVKERTGVDLSEERGETTPDDEEEEGETMPDNEKKELKK